MARISLRVQIALALGATLLLGAAIEAPVALMVASRVAAAEGRASLEGASRLLSASLGRACPGLAPACLESVLGDGRAPPFARVLAARDGPFPPGATQAPLGDGRTLVIPPVGPSAKRGAEAAALLVPYFLLDALVLFVLGFFLLNRAVARPLDRLAAAADRIGKLELEDPLAGGGPTLGRLGLAFERMAQGLKEERTRVTEQIEELTRLNRELADARDSLVRSEKLATVGRLAAGVAHEVGNPLGVIVGYLEISKTKPVPDDVKDYLARIGREVERIDRTVRELLDFSRPGAKPVHDAAVDLREAIDSAVSLSRVQKRLRAIEFEVSVPGGLSILADGHHLSQVLVNLLLNAGDAMDGRGRIRLLARRGTPVGPRRRSTDPPPGGRIELEVHDSGPGIPDADLSRIFDPFFTTKDPGQGTGLGLAICHRIMETFGGEIVARNHPEGGAVLTLSFREAEPSSVRPAAAHTKAPGAQ
jgi:signal transduction histidine kinase